MAGQLKHSAQSTKAAPSSDFFEVTSGWAVIWGVVAACVWLFNHFVADQFGLDRNPTIIADGLLVIATFLAVARLWERLPRVQEIVRNYRHLIILAVVAFLSYQWGQYDYSQSYQTLLGRAAIWSCSKFPECRSTAQHYDMSRNIEIPSGVQAPH